jgi:hypothetical protein
MPDFSFRTRFIKSPSKTLDIDSHRWELPLSAKRGSVYLSACEENTTIRKSPQLVLRGNGWNSKEEAWNEAERYTQALALSLARVKVGANFGKRAPKSGYFGAGLKMLGQQQGQRMLNDVHGIMVFETEPQPLFARFEASGAMGIPKERFESVLLYALEHPRELTDRERVCLDLFHASFFQKMVDVRFLLLMMAIEALLVPGQRSPAAIQHVETMIDSTRKANLIGDDEKNSIIRSLNGLRTESIGHTGRKYVAERLGSRKYSSHSASDFFSECYKLRSRLVHGSSPYPWQEVSEVVEMLELFVSDLLSGPLIDVGI